MKIETDEGKKDWLKIFITKKFAISLQSLGNLVMIISRVGKIT